MGNQTILLLLLLASACVKECSSNQVLREACASKEKCTDCIQTSGCQWCSAPMEDNGQRCRHSSESTDEWCPLEDLDNPIRSASVVKDDKLGEYNGRSVQIKPQLVDLKLRVDEPYELTFQYKRAEDHPVDLYYLMDLSGSMEDDKDNLANLGGKLAETMRSITKNFKIGFGSFVDKVEAPYVSTAPKRILKPCADTATCSAPYSFKNQMPLNSDHTLFSIRVREAQISGNLDSPEGGFDALMQAIVCSKEIGWRPEARHLLVFSTDASFHLAGDGKLAGIILPNDAKCHMVNDEYEKAASLTYDYPSIAQLNQKAQDNNINLIFAVTARHKELYQQLQHRILGASFGILDGDSSNVIELVRSEYEKLRGIVALDYADVDGVEVTFKSTCVGQPEMETKECRNLQFQHVVNFTATIRVYKCPGPDTILPLEIKLLAIDESLKVNVEVLCSCACEEKNFEANSIKCNEGGNLTCGICACDDQHVGRNCECRSDVVDFADDNSKCISNNVTCSGLGICKCGVCQCNPRNSPAEKIYGKFCECNNYSCDRKGTLLCSGPSQGECKCGQCVCKPGWTGPACDCRQSTDECAQITDDGTKVFCSNQGSCVCGACKCKVTDNERYSGKYCGECHTCPVDQLCEDLKFCVDCQAYNSKHQECGKCIAHNITKFETLREGEDVDSSKGEYRCLALVEACRLEFIYKYVEGSSFYIEALLEKDCTISGNVMAIILGVTGGTVILGLLFLIIWKVLTSIHDRREYVKFEKERALAKWDRGDNPLYKPSTQTFNNPTFGN